MPLGHSCVHMGGDMLRGAEVIRGTPGLNQAATTGHSGTQSNRRGPGSQRGLDFKTADWGDKLKYPLERRSVRRLLTHPHGCKDDGKVLGAVVHDVFGLLDQAGLATDLGRNLERTVEKKERDQVTTCKHLAAQLGSI